MPRKCRKKRIMIVVDEREPVGELPPPFPSRNIKVKQDEDIRKLYDLKKEIGRGRFGTVYMVEDKATGQKFAAKFVSTKRNQDRANVQREVEIMKALNSERSHPRLIQLYDVYEMAKEMCLVLEIVDGGELFERVIDDDFLLTERACTVFIRQICEGIEFIHSKNILHLDMKPENILCLSREGNRIKICDFGLARRYDPRKKLQVLFGTPEFVAPEVVNFEPISYGTDMWSVGVICYVLLSGLSPFMGHNYVETMTNVTHNKYDFEDEAFDSVSEDAKDFIQKMLVLDKSLRLTPAQCQRHEWLRKPPGSRTLRRSRFFACSDSESGSETEDSDECSESESEEETIVERIAREEKIKREQEFMAPEANRKEMDKQIEDKKRELEKIKKKEEEDKRLKEEAEAKRKAVEEEIEENKRREAEKIRREERQEEERREREADRRKKEEAERKQKEEAERKQKEEAERKQKEEAERKQKEEAERKKEEEAERKQKEVEKRKKEEAERKERESEQKKEEQLERTKKQLKEFVERWNSHPNSPYLVGTPLPFDLQRIVSIGGWDSRTSVSSMAVAPPTDLPDPKVLDEDVFIFNDFDNGTSQGILINEVDNQEDEEFTMYKINPPEPKQPPSDVARQLEIKLKILQQENKISEGEGAVADVEESGKESNRSTRKLSDITNKNKENVHTSEESCKSKGSKKVDEQKSSVEINIEDIMGKKRVVQIPDKMRGEQMEKHKRAYEERKRKQSLEQMRDKTAEELKQEEESKEKEKIKKVILPIKRTKSRLSQEPIEAEKIINDILQVDHKSAYEEYKKMMNDVAKYSGGSNNTDQKCEIVVNGIQNGKENIQRSVNNNVDLKKKEQEKIDHQENEEYLKTVKQTNTKKDEKVINNSTEKMTPKQLQRQVSDATKASELKFGGSGKGDALQLKRPEILALQNEEIGGILPRQRKKSTPQVDQPNMEDSNFSPRGSRGSTPIKQLKKMPSRDVPLQSSNPIPIPVEDGASLQCQQSLEPSSSPRCKTLSRGHSRDDRPPSRESDRGGRPGNRRPSRDVPLNPAQMERLLSASCLGSPDLISPAPQAWPDLIVAPQGEEDNEELDDYKDSLDVPVAKLVKSPSGTLISVPGLKVSQDDRPPAAQHPASPPAASPSLCSRGESFSDDPAYVSKNKMVAWILDIGTNQLPQAQSACTTNKRVNQWESRSPSPRLTPSPTSDHSPKCHEISPLPPDQGREKSPQATQNLPPIKPMSREPSSDNLCINTPWGTLRRSPSNLSKSSSSDVSANSARDTSPAALTKSASQSQHSEGKERPISPRPPAGRLQRQMATDKCTSHISDEIQPKPPETSHERWQQEGRNQGDTKSHTLPRPSKLTKQQSLANFTTYSGNNRNEAKKLSPLDISKEFDDEESQGLKRKSKFPTSPNHKKKIGPMLFSAQDRISQFENQKPINGTKQLPLTRTRSSINLTLSSDCPLERSKSGININGSKTGDKTQIGFLRTRLLDKGGKAVVASLPEEPDIIPTSRHTLTRFKT